METRTADLALRLSLIVAGLAGMVLFMVLATATEGWRAGFRLAVLLLPAGVTLATLMAGAELREPFEQRTRYGGRRRGAEGAIDLRRFGPADTAPPVGSPAAEAPPASFAIRRRNTVVALALTAATAAVMAPVALDALAQPDLTETGLVAMVVLAPALFYSARSLLRLVASSWAIRLDHERITLGLALGFVPPLRLARSQLRAIVDARESTGLVHLVVDPSTGYRIRADHLVAVDALLATVASWWPELPIVTAEPHDVAPPSFEDLAPQIEDAPTESSQDPIAAATRIPARRPMGDGAGPPPARIRSARQVLRRRTWLAGGVFLVAVVGMFPASWWYLSQRADNDRVLGDGIVVRAVVTDVDRSAFGPDSMKVAFTHEGVEYVRTIHSGFFSSYSRTALGNEIEVSFDPANPRLVRLADRRNIHELTWVALLGAGAVGLLASLGLARTLHDRLTLDTAQWSRGRVHGIPRSGRTPATIVLEGAATTPPQVLRGAFGLGKGSIAHAPAWLGIGRRTLVVLPDDLDHLVLTSSLPSELA